MARKAKAAPVAAAAKAVEVGLTIKPPNIVTAEFAIEGTAPYVQHKFSQKALDTMRATQEAGSTSRKGKKKEPKNFERCYLDSRHVSEEGWVGIPAPAFRSAMVSACRLCGFQMTKAKLSVFVEADGFDEHDGTPLVRIEGEHEMHIAAVRLSVSTTDLRARPMWRRWGAKVRIRYDADQFTNADVANLLSRVGQQVGIGEGRPDSRASTGMGWGLFRLV